MMAIAGFAHAVRAAAVSFETPPRLPRSIYQSVPGSVQDLRPEVSSLLAQNEYLSEGFWHDLFGDREVQAFMARAPPRVARAYWRIAPAYGAARSDLWRYCALHLLGGVYYDADGRLLQNLGDVIFQNDSAVLDILRGGERWRTQSETFIRCNGFLAFERRHPILQRVISDIVAHAEARAAPVCPPWLKRAQWPLKSGLTCAKYQVLQLTGPDGLARALKGNGSLREINLPKAVNFQGLSVAARASKLFALGPATKPAIEVRCLRCMRIALHCSSCAPRDSLQRLYGSYANHYSQATSPLLGESTPKLDQAVSTCQTAGLADDSWSGGLWEYGAPASRGWLFFVRIQSTASTAFTTLLSRSLRTGGPVTQLDRQLSCRRLATQGYCDPRQAADSTCRLCGQTGGCAAALWRHVSKLARRNANFSCRVMYEAHVPYAAYLAVSSMIASKSPHAFIVLLREPQSRTASELAHRLRARNNGQWEAHVPVSQRLVRPFESIDDVLNCNGTTCLLANRMTCMLGEDDCTAQTFANEQTLATALTRLKRMSLVLLSERFVDSMLLMRWAFPDALDKLEHFALLEQRDRLSSFTTRQRAAIVELNRLDARLYASALLLFECHLARLRADPTFDHHFERGAGGRYALKRSTQGRASRVAANSSAEQGGVQQGRTFNAERERGHRETDKPNPRAPAHKHGPQFVWFEHVSKSGGSFLCECLRKQPTVLRPRNESWHPNCLIGDTEHVDARVGNWTRENLLEFFDSSKSQRLLVNEWDPLPRWLLSEPRVRLVAILRDPVLRLLSAHRFWYCEGYRVSSGASNLCDATNAAAWLAPPEEWAERPDDYSAPTRTRAAAAQARWLGALRQRPWLSNHYVRRFSGVGWVDVRLSRAELQRAFSTLKMFHHVLIQQESGGFEGLQGLKDAIGAAEPCEERIVPSGTAGTYNLSLQAREHIAYINRFDVQLFLAIQQAVRTGQWDRALEAPPEQMLVQLNHAPTAERYLRSIVGLMIEPRDVIGAITRTVDGFRSALPISVRLQVFARPSVVPAARASGLTSWRRGVWMRTLRRTDLRAAQYNRLFTTPAFWQECYGEKVLVFQTDTVLCPNSGYDLLRFLSFDYIGAGVVRYSVSIKDVPTPAALLLT